MYYSRTSPLQPPHRRSPNFGRTYRDKGLPPSTSHRNNPPLSPSLLLVVILLLFSSVHVGGVLAYPAPPSLTQNNYLSEPIAAGSDYKSLRLNTTFSDNGIINSSTVIMNITVSARAAVVYATGQNTVGTIVDFRGNMYKLRSTYSTGFGMGIDKKAFDVGFTVGVPNQTIRDFRSLYEIVGRSNDTVASANYRCRLDEPYLCCNDPNQTSHRYYSAEYTDVPAVTCLVPNEIPPVLLDYYGSSVTLQTFLGVSSETSVSVPFTSNTRTTISSTTGGNMKLTSSLPSDFLDVVFRQVRSSSSMCVRGSFTTPSDTPFFVDVAAFGNGLRQIGLTYEDYMAKRGCDDVPQGFPISYSTNLTDNFASFMMVQSFGTSGSNQFSCEWRGLFSTGNVTSPPKIRLYCPQDTALTLVSAATVPTTAFQPLFPFVKLMGSTGIWDERLQRFRVSVQLWSTNENDAVVTTTVTHCYLQYGTTAAYGPYTQADKTIKAGHVDRIHFMVKGVQLPVNTPLNQVIGYCVVRVSVSGVVDQYGMFPELEAINVSIASLSTKPNSKFIIPDADKSSPTKVWQRRYLGNPVSPKDAQARKYSPPGIIPAQVNRRREHLRSRYRSEPLLKLMSMNAAAATAELPDRSPQTLIASSTEATPPALKTINNISGFQNPNLWTWGSTAQRNRFISGIDRSDVVVFPSPGYLYPVGSDPYLNEDGTYKNKEMAAHIASLPLYGDGSSQATPTEGPSNPNAGGNDTSGRVTADGASSPSVKAASAVLLSFGVILLIAAVVVLALSAAFYWIMRRRRMIIAQFMTIDDKAPKRLRRLLKQRRKELRQQRREAASNDKTSAISANTSADGTLENAYNPHTEIGKVDDDDHEDTSSDVSSSESDPDNDTLNIQPVVCGTDSRVNTRDDATLMIEGSEEEGGVKLTIQ